MWCYITAAPPGTAIYHKRHEGWTIGDHIAAEQLYEARKLGWRYTALHFKGGKDIPFPDQIPRPGLELPEVYDGPTWETATPDEIEIAPEVIALFREG